MNSAVQNQARTPVTHNSAASTDQAADFVAVEVEGKSLAQRLRLPLMIAGPLLVLLVSAYLYIVGGRYESTDDARIRAAQVNISSNVAGRVTQLAVHDNQLVHRGDLLFKLDDAPLGIAVAQAEAQLGNARLQVQSLKATYRQRQADLMAARDTLNYRRSEFERQQRLLSKGISSQAQFDAAVHAKESAEQQYSSVEQQLAAALSSLGGSADVVPEKHPAMMAAQAQLDQARLDLSYTTVTAPQDGIVTKVEALQVGSYINAAQPVFALVSTNNVWVEANFKEVQLAHMRPGQTAEVTIDALAGRTFKATVASVSPGTGSEFSALPAENATGNWVKVVQRIPVRLQLVDAQITSQLQSGLSAVVTVDTEFHRGLFGADTQGDIGHKPAVGISR
jgi:membrane fusion protein, multidrug efflux system